MLQCQVWLAKFDKKLKSKFDQTFKFWDGYFICKFALLLCEGAYPYKYMDEWDKFEKTSLSLPFQNFYSSLHLEKLAKLIRDMQKRFGILLKLKILATIIIYFCKVILLYCVMFFDILPKCILKSMTFFLVIFILHLIYYGLHH